MEITTDSIKELREATGVSVMQCRQALEEAKGDVAQALVILKKHSAVSALKKADRSLAAGTIGTYSHDGAIGAMVVLSCETDFVAKNPDFVALARSIAMQVAAMDPETTDDLLTQSFIKEESTTIQALLNEATQKFGERVEVSRFTRISIR